MVHAVPDILARIVDTKRVELAQLAGVRADLERRAADRLPARDFRGALLANPPAVIAEIKKASPSKGVFLHDYQPATIAGMYLRRSGVAGQWRRIVTIFEKAQI